MQRGSRAAQSPADRARAAQSPADRARAAQDIRRGLQAYLARRSEGWARSGPAPGYVYEFSRGGRRVRATHTGIRRDGTDALYVTPQGGGFFAQPKGSGYALTRVFGSQLVAKIRLYSQPMVEVDGGVPLFALLNTTTVKNLRGKTQVVPKYGLFDREGQRWIRDPRYPRELTTDEKMDLVLPPPEPALCAGQRLDLRDQRSCFVRGMGARLASQLRQLGEAQRARADLCKPPSQPAELQPHQRAVFNLAKTMAAKSVGELGGYRGLLCYHSVGSGKTVTSLGIMLAFWASPRRIVLATTPANEADNNLHRYALNLFCFFPEYVRIVFARPAAPYPPPPWTLGNKALQAWCKSRVNIAPLVNRVRTYTFTTLASELGLPKRAGDGVGRARPAGPALLTSGAGSVLIMDEVQSLFTPDPRYARAARFLAPLLTRDDIRAKMFAFALTATPGNSVADMVNVLNFVRPSGARPFVPADAAAPERFAGLVSYVDIRSDTTRHGTKQVRNVYVQMSPRYYAAYLKTLALTPADLDYARAEGASKEMAFLLKQRTAGNFLIKTAVTGLYTPAELAEFMRARPIPKAVPINGSQVRLMSDKLIAALENALTMPGKQYMWVAELTTSKVLASALTRMGYTQVLPRDFVRTRDARGRTIFAPGPSLAAPGRRFILYKKGSVAGELLDEAILTAYSALFNDRANDAGGAVKLLLATETYYQGLDMRALQGVHLVDALFNATADKQAVGRALRLCGHSGAPSKRVTVYRYFSVPPAGYDPAKMAESLKGVAKTKVAATAAIHKRVLSLVDRDVFKKLSYRPEGVDDSALPSSVNTYVFADAARRQQPVERFELGLKAFAIDCPLFKGAYHQREAFACGARPTGRTPVAAPGTSLLVAPKIEDGRSQTRSPTRSPPPTRPQQPRPQQPQQRPQQRPPTPPRRTIFDYIKRRRTPPPPNSRLVGRAAADRGDRLVRRVRSSTLFRPAQAQLLRRAFSARRASLGPYRFPQPEASR